MLLLLRQLLERAAPPPPPPPPTEQPAGGGAPIGVPFRFVPFKPVAAKRPRKKRQADIVLL